MTSMPWLVAAAAFAFACMATPVVRGLALRLGIVDTPNHRSSHVRPTARAGGVAILLGAALAIAFFAPHAALRVAVALTAAAIAIVGFIDDVRGLRASLRLVVQLAAAAVAAIGGALIIRTIDVPLRAPLALGLLALPLTVFWLVAMTNAYNFMDGINGIASLQAIAAGGGLALIFVQRGDAGAAAVAAALAGAAAGFLPWNFPKASIFMGDVASGTLGFLFAALVVRAANDGESFIAASLVLLPFYADSGVTLLRRLARRERVFEAHRSHFYQRLNGHGWSHARVSLLWFALALCASGVAAAYRHMSSPSRAGAVIALVLLHVAVALAITAADRRRDRTAQA